MDSEVSVHAVFVYGTLKHDQLRGGMWPRQPRSIQQGIVRANLYDLGPYPAITEGLDWVLGEVWCFEAGDMKTTLNALDDIECYRPGDPSSEYQRKVIRATLVGRLDADLSDDSIEQSSSEALHIDCFTYVMGHVHVVSRYRRIHPCVLRNNLTAAQWPDQHSRVPKSVQDE